MNDLKSKGRNTFWTINVGHIITLVVYIVTGSYWVGQFKAELTQTKQTVEQHETKMLQISEKVSKLDTEGTTQQRIIQKANDTALENHELRLRKLEELNSKISSVEAKMDAMSADVKFMKELVLRGNIRIFSNETNK